MTPAISTSHTRMEENSPQKVSVPEEKQGETSNNASIPIAPSFAIANSSTTPADLMNSEIPKEEGRDKLPDHNAISSDDSLDDMLVKTTPFFGQMADTMKTNADSENAEIPTAAIPGFLDQDPLRAGGPTFNAFASSSLEHIPERLSRSFKLLDNAQQWVEGLTSKIDGYEAPSSEPGSTNSKASPPSLNSKSQQQQRPAPASFFDADRKWTEILLRAYQTNENILHLSILHNSQRLVAVPEDDEDYPLLQSSLGLDNFYLYEQTWGNDTLEAGMKITTLALDKVRHLPEFGRVALTPIIPVTIVRSWAYGQRLLIQRDGDVDMSHDMVSLVESCWDIFKDIEALEDQAKIFLRRELALCLLDRYRSTGSLSCLNSSIGHLKALNKDERKGPSDPYTISLGMARYERFLHCGDMDDLDSALYHGQKGCGIEINFFPSSTTSSDEPSFDAEVASGNYLSALGLAERFNVTLDVMDLDKAVKRCRKAVDSLHPSHPLHPSYKSSLALILYARYDATKDARDMETALQVIRTAVEESKAVVGRHLFVPLETIQGYLTVMSLDTTTANIPAIEAGIRMITKSRKAFSGALHVESKIESYLSKCLLRLFRSAATASDASPSASSDDDEKHDYFDSALDHAILAFQKAPEDSPSKHQFGLDMAHLILEAYQSGRSPDCDEAIAQFCNTALSSTWPFIRLEAAIQWANTLEGKDPEGALDALQMALDIVPSVASLGERMPIQYNILSKQRSSIPQRAAMHAIDVKDLLTAVSCLEKGRNVMWAQALQIRAGHMLPPGDSRQKEFKSLARYFRAQRHGVPLSTEGLEEHRRHLSPDQVGQSAPILQQLRSTLSELTKRTVELRGAEQADRDRERMNEFREGFMDVYNTASLHGTAKRWNELLSEFDELRGALSFDEETQKDLVPILKSTNGTVVILNVYGSRCDGIIIRPALDSDKLVSHHVPFPGISPDEIHAWAEGLREGMDGLAAGDITLDKYENEYLIPVLRGLWQGIACPILDHFATQSGVEDDTTRRVWWYPTGQMMFVPVHAASPCEGNKPGLLDLVISSYIPSIYSLIRASKSPRLQLKVVAVGQPESPGLARLPYAEKEVNALKRVLREDPERLTILMSEEGKIYPVVSAIPNHTFLHLSCHAHQDEQYPFNSAFHLHDGPLKLSRIMDLDLGNVQFAYLSACLTSAGDTAVPDESIHLAAGMQFAGVGSVVATMWSVEDRVAAAVSSRVYGHLLRNGSEKADARESAEALYEAIAAVKKAGTPLTFIVPFIHLGL